MTDSAMRAAIAHKRDGGVLDDATWSAIVAAYVGGDVDDAQMAALLMACFLRGIDGDETAALTRAMAESGRTLEPPAPGCVDKHSTGGVADCVSLIVVPLVAACGVPVAKLSGGALGHTGGTLDKLRAVEGVRVDLSAEEFAQQVRSVGCAIAAPGADLAPADARLYALRDRTATVASLGLVAASIVSKKIAGGAPSIVYDVKVGRGALFADPGAARVLAASLVTLTRAFGRGASALGTDMDEPLGTAIGTGLDVLEARAYLRGERRDARLAVVCERVAIAMLAAGGFDGDPQRAIEDALASGAAGERFDRMLRAQGARTDWADRLQPHGTATTAFAARGGFVTAVDAVALGTIARTLVERDGPGAGIHVAARVGESMEPGRPLATVFGDASFAPRVAAAFTIEEAAPQPRPPVYFEMASSTLEPPVRDDGERRSTLETR